MKMSISSQNTSGLSRYQMKPPYRQEDLLSISSFISYCKDRGVDTSREQLEYYDRYNLLIPIAHVNFTYGGISSGRRDWLIPYEKDRLVIYPWKEYQKIGNDFITFYSKYQIYTLAEIQKTSQIDLSESLLFDANIDWTKVGENIRNRVIQKIPYIHYKP